MGKGAPAATNQTTQEKMDDVMKAQVKHLPELNRITAESILPYERKLLEASKEIQPQYTQAQMDLYKQYGPEMNRIGMDVQAQNARQQAAYEADLLKNQGADLTRSAQALQREVDPEYYAMREAQGRKMNELLNSYDVNGLSGGEAANVERNLNRMNETSGISGMGTSTEALRGASAFDDRLQQKKSALAQALAQVPNALQSSKSGVDVMQQSVGRPSAMNTGENKFMSYQQPNIGAPSQTMSGQLLNTVNSAMGQASNEQMQQANIKANWDPYRDAKSVVGMVNQTFSTITGAAKPM